MAFCGESLRIIVPITVLGGVFDHATARRVEELRCVRIAQVHKEVAGRAAARR